MVGGLPSTRETGLESHLNSNSPVLEFPDLQHLQTGLNPHINLSDTIETLVGLRQKTQNKEEFVQKRVKTYTHELDISNTVEKKITSIEAALKILKYETHDAVDVGNYLKEDFRDLNLSLDGILQKFGNKKEWKSFRKELHTKLEQRYTLQIDAVKRNVEREYQLAEEFEKNPDATINPQLQFESLIDELHDVKPDYLGRIWLDEKGFLDTRTGALVSYDAKETAKTLREMGYDKLQAIEAGEYFLDDSAVININGRETTIGNLKSYVSLWIDGSKLLHEDESLVASVAAPYVNDPIDEYTARKLEKDINDSIKLQFYPTQSTEKRKSSKWKKIGAGVGIGLLALGIGAAIYKTSQTHTTTTTSTSPTEITTTTSHPINTTTSISQTEHGPQIHSLYYKVTDQPLLMGIYVNASDPKGVSKAILQLNGQNETMKRLTNGLFAENVTIPKDGSLLTPRVYVFDPASRFAIGDLSVPSDVALAQNFAAWAQARGYNSDIASMFFNSYPNYFKPPFGVNDTVVLAPLSLADRNGSLTQRNVATLLMDQVYRDRTVSDKTQVIVYASNLLNQLGVNGFYQIGSIRTAGNYSEAVEQSKLPALQLSTVKSYLQATEREPALADFTPVVVKDVNGKLITAYKSADVSRDTWMIGKLGEDRPIIFTPSFVKNQGGWIHAMTTEAAYALFDSPRSASVLDGVKYSPFDPKVWTVIDPEFDFFNTQPAVMQSDGLQIPFPYNNETLLAQNIPDWTNRTFAEHLMFAFPTQAYNQTSQKLVTGLNGMLLGEQQWSSEYQAIKNLYKQAVIDESAVYSAFPNFNYQQYKSLVKVVSGNPSEDYYQARFQYWGWLGDRYYHGLPNTVTQFLTNDKSLTQNWKPWDLIRFIIGYENSNSANWGGEWNAYAYGYPVAFRGLLTPYSTSGDASDPKTGYGWEWSAGGIPQSVLSQLKSQNQIISGYGNNFGLLFDIEGVKKDRALGETINVYQNVEYDYAFSPNYGKRIFLD